jgi:hypothetical protein
MLAPAILPAYVSSAARIVRRRVAGPRRFQGDAAAICRAIVEACWTGDYLAASAGHFRQFWTRDLGFSAGSLVRLGHRARVEASLDWALEVWSHRGRVTTTIFAGRRPADVYRFGVDSLPLLLATMEACGAEHLVGRHGHWLEREVARFAEEVLDARTGLVRDDRRFSTHRDTVITGSNCYANTMLVVLDGVLRRTGWLTSPLPPDSGDRFLEAFWRADHFSDRRGRDLLTGDANVFPFWLGIVPHDAGLRIALDALAAAGLTRPLPLRYAARRNPRIEDRVQRWFVPDYQGTSIWTSLGAMYLSLLGRVDAAAATRLHASLAALIERDGTLWEVLADDLRPYRGRLGLFVADEGMLWAAILLLADKDLEQARRKSGPSGPAASG